MPGLTALVRSLWRPALGVALAVLCAELLVRQFWLHQRVFQDGYVKTAAPHSRTTWGLEGWAISSRGAYAIRDGHQPGGVPVLVLGDSYTEGLQVSNSSVFTAVAERAARQRGAPLTVLNAGVAGRSFADYLLFADRHRSLFSPAWTVVQLSQHDFAGDAFDPGRNHLVRTDDGEFRPEQREFPDSPIKELIWDFPLISVRYSFRRLKDFLDAMRYDPPSFSALDAPPAHDTVDPVEALLDATAAAYEGRVTFAYIPELAYAPPRLSARDLSARIRQHCMDRGYSCVLPVAQYLKLAESGHAPVGFVNTRFNYGHLNARGHTALGLALASELVRLHDTGRLAP